MTFHQRAERSPKTSAARAKPTVEPASGATGAIADLQQRLGNRGMQRLLAAQLKRDPAQRAAEPEEEELQLKRDPSKPAQLVQRKANGGNGIPGEVLQKMEASFGASFSDVNVHVGSQAQQLGALAYTQGNDIHFAPGQFRPDTRAGQELLGHELAHVVQQREGRVRPTGEVNGVPLNDSETLEAEADRLGAKAAGG